MIGDMPLQTSFISQNKGKHFYLMFCHIMTYCGAIGIALHLLDIFNWYYILWIAIGHVIMDMWKSRQIRDDAHFWMIYIDQGWHYLQLLMIVLLIQVVIR